ncbi:MAG: hypothetical protein IT449_01190 [Phycisphaerales bacterium]|nr:hypothetical protein [Phycisphaerales bacterium]
MNNCGQVVFDRRMGATWAFGEVFVYDNGRTFRLTNNMDRDVGPDINDSGQIVWARGVGSGGASMILHYDHGDVKMLAQNADGVLSPKIANTGHCTWPELLADGCHGVDTRILLWDGFGSQAIIDAGGSHQSPRINDADQLVWTDYDFCPDPWLSDILYYEDEEIRIISSEDPFQRQAATVNDERQILWDELWKDGEDFTDTLILYDSGVRTVFTDWGEIARNNNHGDVSFSRWYEDDGIYRSWISLQGTFYLITPDPDYSYTTDINEYGEVTLAFDDYPTADVGLMRRIRTGEADFDGDFDLADHREWTRCLDGPEFLERNRTDPTDTLCDCRFLDVDHDNDVDLRDFARFQNAFAPSQ